MPLPRIFDRIRMSSTTTGTGNFTLTSLVSQSYRDFSDTDTFNVQYCIECIATGQYEIGIGYWDSGASEFVRVSNIQSSEAFPVDFDAGTKNIFVTAPAYWLESLTEVHPFLLMGA